MKIVHAETESETPNPGILGELNIFCVFWGTKKRRVHRDGPRTNSLPTTWDNDQVDRNFDGEDAPHKEAEQASDRKNDAKQGFGIRGMWARQRAWLTKASAKKANWRPVDLKRVGAKRWLQNLDNQVQWSTPWTTGLSHLIPSDANSVWEHWSQWPHAALSIDLGSDGLAGAMALQYHWKANIHLRPDPSHGGTCDFDLALGAAEVKGLWLCLVLSWNLPFGVHADETRAHQLKEVMQSVFEKHEQPNMPLFVSMISKLELCYRNLGHSFDQAGLEEAIWTLLASRPWYQKLGRKCSMARFHSALHTAKEKVPYWWIDCFERTCTSLETDNLKGKALLSKIATCAGRAEQSKEGGTSTNTATITMEDRATMFGACGNALAVSTWILSDPHNERLCQIIIEVSSPLLAWHTDQTKQLRSAEGNEAGTLNEFWNL